VLSTREIPKSRPSFSGFEIKDKGIQKEYDSRKHEQTADRHKDDERNWRGPNQTQCFNHKAQHYEDSGNLSAFLKLIYSQHHVPAFQNLASFKCARSCATSWQPLEIQES